MSDHIDTLQGERDHIERLNDHRRELREWRGDGKHASLDAALTAAIEALGEVIALQEFVAAYDTLQKTKVADGDDLLPPLDDHFEALEKLREARAALEGRE